MEIFNILDSVDNPLYDCKEILYLLKMETSIVANWHRNHSASEMVRHYQTSLNVNLCK